MTLLIALTGSSSFTGVGAATLPQFSDVGSGVHGVTGVGTGTLPSFSGSGSGTYTLPTFTGTGAASLPSLTGSGAGTVTAPESTLQPIFGGYPGEIIARGALPQAQQQSKLLAVKKGLAPKRGRGAATLPSLTGKGTGTVTKPDIKTLGLLDSLRLRAIDAVNRQKMAPIPAKPLAPKPQVAKIPPAAAAPDAAQAIDAIDMIEALKMIEAIEAIERLKS